MNPGAISHYRIVGEIGRGGMGVVYEAEDERLGRRVALKLLPEAHFDDAAARERFEREARAASSLNHPHICTVYDVGEHAGRPFIVMELIDGIILDRHIAGRPLPTPEILKLGAQIADALDAAHAEGILHRDVKPQNVAVTARGDAKVLDFGLAKRVAGDSADAAASTRATQPGALLGTVGYMSPEQALGRLLDARSDLFSLGAVLYEMATGKPAFRRDTAGATFDAILHGAPEPPRERNPDLPQELARIVNRCLEKDPDFRYQHASDLRADLKRAARDLGTGTGGPRPARGPADAMAADERPLGELRAAPPGSRWIPLARRSAAWTAALLLGALAATLLGRRTPLVSPSPVVRFVLDMPEGTRIRDIRLALSADGRQLAFSQTFARSGDRIWVRSLDSSRLRALSEAVGISPRWSPDGGSLAYCAVEGIHRVDVATGTVSPVVRGLSNGLCTAGGWSADGRLFFSAGDSLLTGRILSVPARGGTPEVVLEPDTSSGPVGHWDPALLPDGRHLLYSVFRESGPSGTALVALDRPEERPLLVRSAFHVLYSPTGHLLYVRDGVLVAHPFDVGSGELTGDPVAVVSPVAVFTPDVPSGLFSISGNGVLAYARPGATGSELVWLDREGRRLGTLGRAGAYRKLELSANGRRVAAQLWAGEQGPSDVWTLDARRGVPTRITSEAGWDTAVWLPGGDELVVGSQDGARATVTRLFRTSGDGGATASPLFEVPGAASIEDVSPDGTALLIAVPGVHGSDVLVAPTSGDGTPRRLLEIDAAVDRPQVSPDGRWVAYCTDESGGWDVYLAPFGREGPRRRVSPDGGCRPRWRGDGRELYYADTRGLRKDLMAVDVEPSEGSVVLGVPRRLFELPNLGEYDVTADGERFLVIAPIEEEDWSVEVVLNWPSLLETGDAP